MFEIIVALAGIATAVILYPSQKTEQHAGFGACISRVLEASTMFVGGVAFLLTALGLHPEGPRTDTTATSRAFVILYDRIFLLGQGFIPAINDLLLGILLYKSRLVTLRFLL